MLPFIFVVCLAGLFINYRKMIICLAPLSLVFSMFDFMGMPISLFDAIAIASVCLYPIANNTRNELSFGRYPFKLCSLLTFVSIAGTNYFIDAHWPSTTCKFVSGFLYPVILWKVMDSKESVSLFARVFFFFAFCLGCYSAIELLLGSNPLISYFATNEITNVNVLDYQRFRFGIKQCQSFLSTPAPAGLAFSMIGLFVYLTMSEIDFLKKYGLLIICICIFGILVTGSRTAIAAGLVAFLPAILLEFKKPKFLYLKIIVTLTLLAVAMPFLMQIVTSFTDTTSVDGSSAELRQYQWLSSLYFWMLSPIWGNGYAFVWWAKTLDLDLAGAESIWFQTLIDYGLVGALAYLSCFVSTGYALIKRHFLWVFIPLTFLAAKTMSSVLNMEISFMFVFVVALLKYDDYYLKNEEADNEENDG